MTGTQNTRDMTRAPVSPSGGPPGSLDLDRAIARLLGIGAYVSVALLAIGVVLMAANGISPLSGGGTFDLGRVPGDVAAFRPTGFLWLGLITTMLTPLARVSAALIGYLRGGERRMAVIAFGILIVILMAIILGVLTEQ